MLGDDCDDACADCHPGGTEICDGEDNDCANGADDTFACVQGTTTACTTTCSTTGEGTCSAECTMPTACTPPAEVCNEADDDCDDLVDEGVLTFGERIEYALEGEPLALTASTADLAVFSHDMRGVHLQHLGPDGSVLSSHVAVLAGDFSTVAASAVSAARALVGGIDRSTGAITIAEIDLHTGGVTQGPRTIGTRSGGGYEQLRIIQAGVPLVVYNSGSQIFARGGTWSGSFTERVVASGVEGFARFDAIRDPAALSSAYVAFAAYPDGGTANSEIMVQRISGFGVTEGAPHRVTMNGLRDVDPTLSTAGADLSIVWFQGASVDAVSGVASIQVVSPLATGLWTVLGESVTTDTAANLYGWMRSAQRGGGFTLTFTGGGSSSARAAATIAPVSRDGTVIGPGQLLDSSEKMTFSYALAADEAGLTAFYVAVRAEDDVRFFGRRLICP